MPFVNPNQNIQDAIQMLHSGKPANELGLTAEHFKNSPSIDITFLTICFNTILKDKQIPDIYSKSFEMTGVTVIPLLLFMFIGFFPFCNAGVTMPVLKISGICLSFKMALKQIVRNVISIRLEQKQNISQLNLYFWSQ
jgi:hypothetical protein